MKLEGLLSNKDFEDKYYEILDKIESKNQELASYNQTKDNQNEIKMKLKHVETYLKVMVIYKNLIDLFLKALQKKLQLVDTI